jgi:hypothetical protein
VGLRITATAGGPAATGEERLRLRRSRRNHEIEDLNEQYAELVVRLEDIWERGRVVRGHLADSLANQAGTTSSPGNDRFTAERPHVD